MYFYKQTRFSSPCYTVGYYNSNKEWIPITDYTTEGTAIKQVNYLNQITQYIQKQTNIYKLLIELITEEMITTQETLLGRQKELQESCDKLLNSYYKYYHINKFKS